MGYGHKKTNAGGGRKDADISGQIYDPTYKCSIYF